MSEITIPVGYKKTEIGFIPNDWNVMTIHDIASFSGGSQPPKSTFISSPRDNYIRLIQIRDYKTSKFESYIPEYLANKKCNSTDIMIGRYGPPIFQILRGIDGAYNVALIKATPKSGINQEYLYYFLKTEKLFQLMEVLSRRSSGQTGVDLPALKSYPIPLPKIEEQTTIANALSDVDNLIQSLERLISKKDAIKTATMQQLLTGKTRLPEFSTRDDGSKKGFKQTDLGHIPEDWELDNIRGISLLPTQNGLFYEPTRKGSGIPLINVSDMYKSAPIQVGYLELFDATPNEISVFKVTAGDLLFTRSSIVPSGIAFCNIFESNRDDVVFDSHLIRVRPNSRIIDPRFLYLNCISNHARTALISEAKTATMTTIDQGAINRCPVLIPPKKEQTAIATILSDMDAEIQSLNTRLAKTQDIKQGMMQQLLTGKVRLVSPSNEKNNHVSADKGNH